MNDPLSQEFVTAFITTCFDAGIPEKRAAELLQKESVDQVRRGSPAWAGGYDSIIGDCKPMLFGNYSNGIEKSAFWQGLRHGGKALLSGFKPTGSLGMTMFRTGQAMGAVPRAAVGFARKRPLTSALLGVGVGGAATKFLSRDRLDLRNQDPFFSSGSYTPDSYKDYYDATLDKYKPGIFAHNNAYENSAAHIAELQRGVDSGYGGEAAYRDLAAAKRAHEKLRKARDEAFGSVEETQQEAKELTERLANRAASLEAQRTNIWGLPKRIFRGPDAEDAYFDDRIGKVQNRLSQARMQGEVAGDRYRMLNSMQTEADTPMPPSREQLQNDFFPAFGAIE